MIAESAADFRGPVDAVRQKGQVRCLLLALPGQVSPKKGGKD